MRAGAQAGWRVGGRGYGRDGASGRARGWPGGEGWQVTGKISELAVAHREHRAAARQTRRHHWNGRHPPSEASQASCLDLRAAPKRGLCGGDCRGERPGAALHAGLAASLCRALA